MHAEYVSKTLSQEIKLEDKEIVETELYTKLFSKYTRNLKENALVPYTKNDNFRRAIIDYGTTSFKKYDKRLRRDVQLLISGLKRKFKYTQEGAKQISIYVIDKKLIEKYK